MIAILKGRLLMMRIVLIIAAIALISATPYVAPVTYPHIEYGICETREMEWIVCLDLHTHIDRQWCEREHGWEFVWTKEGYVPI